MIRNHFALSENKRWQLIEINFGEPRNDYLCQK